jgi:hypothetical protein
VSLQIPHSDAAIKHVPKMMSSVATALGKGFFEEAWTMGGDDPSFAK